MTKGKVVLVPFPFDDLSAAKVRPAVCLTNPLSAHRHVILAFITSRIPSSLANSDIVLNSNDTDFSTTGLRRLAEYGVDTFRLTEEQLTQETRLA
jgi:mRNA interferase MazF